MIVKKEDRGFMKKGKKGRFTINMNVGGAQKVLFLYPELDDDGAIDHWSGPVKSKEDLDEEYQYDQE